MTESTEGACHKKNEDFSQVSRGDAVEQHKARESLLTGRRMTIQPATVGNHGVSHLVWTYRHAVDWERKRGLDASPVGSTFPYRL